MRRVRDVVLLHPFHFPLVCTMFVVSLVFTVFPEALEHTPVSFETRGPIHHIWHYALLLGSALTIVGMFGVDRKSIRTELVGLVMLFSAAALNFVAVVAGQVDGSAEPAGFGLALRAAVILGLGARIVIVIVQPSVPLITVQDEHDGDGRDG